MAKNKKNSKKMVTDQITIGGEHTDMFNGHELISRIEEAGDLDFHGKGKRLNFRH